MLALFWLFLASQTLAGDVVVTMLDVGQADAILVRTPANKTILIDAGDRGANTVEKLVRLGVDHLDLVVATHAHADHIGDMLKVVQALPPKVYVDSGVPHTTQVYSGLMAAIEGNKAISYRSARPGMTFNLDDGAKLEILWPDPAGLLQGTRSDINSNSVVTRLTHGNDCFLFAGDAEAPTEKLLVGKKVGQCDVLKVAHHGSRHSSTAAFLAMLKPSIALISTGAGNRYNHPGGETLLRLEQAKATVYRTDLHGQITLVSTGKGITVTTERKASGAALLAVNSAPQERHEPANATATPTEPGCPFPGSSRSEVFHSAGCGTAASISAKNNVCYESREAALAAGKRPAGCCHP